VPGDPGAHGRFDRKAHPRSFQAWAATHRAIVAATGGAIAAALASAVRSRR
jgi:hypothetical protein